MRPMFTIHAGEFLVGQHIESSFKDKNVWVPTKDSGIDLLVTNSANKKAISLQVKFSRDFLPIMKLEPTAQSKLKSCTWFSLDSNKLSHSKADLWVLVLLGFEKHTYDYIIIQPQQLLIRLNNLHGLSRRYQTYVWVTTSNRAWLTRGASKSNLEGISHNTFTNKDRDLTRHLNNWSKISDL
jgi:hypothetical protein